ncbi:hypothetical protein EPR50_G00123520 [Perca flavescens]|uniref:Uncharacterized protein n=1 Tax=Perca flavescens TaxID=8167 RepID=A0A484CTD1_PERFV|nr:hypothetical protein EPR50_G00123520 [Perca flavescens]
MDPNYDCMGHSRRRSSGPLHRLASDFGLCPLHQWQIQERRVVALRLLLFFYTKTKIMDKNCCSPELACQATWKLSSSSCSSVNIKLFDIL